MNWMKKICFSAVLVMGAVLFNLTAMATGELPQSIIERHQKAQSKVKAKVALILATQSKDASRRQTAKAAQKMLNRHGHKVISTKMVDNDETKLSQTIREAQSQGADTIIVIGGTGFASLDNSIEVVKPLLSKEIPGFGELLRILTFEKWRQEIENRQVPMLNLLTRATGGVMESGTLLFAVPGSPNAVNLSLHEIIIPALPSLIFGIHHKK